MSQRHLRVVDVGMLAVSGDPRDVLATYALGSCVGVVAYDPANRVGGLLHVQLPESSLDPERAVRQPGLFADTGIRQLICRMLALGADRNRLTFRIAGGAQILGDQNLFDVGRKNQAAVKSILASMSIIPLAEDCGGNVSRTLHLHIDTGQLKLRRGAKEAA